MSFASAIDEIKTLIDATGLTYSPDARDGDLDSVDVGRGKFDGSYIIKPLLDIREVQELTQAPVEWQQSFEVQVGVELRRDRLADLKRAEGYMRGVQSALWDPDHTIYANICRIDRQPTVSTVQDDRKLTLKQTFILTYLED